MWIDIIIIFVSFILLFIMYLLANYIKREMIWIRDCGDNERAVKIYKICLVLIYLFSFLFCGVLMYAYVFQ